MKCRGLSKLYGSSRGIEDLDLDVKSGEIFGFLGPNGAGKTTTIRLLMGFIRPSRGQARILGMDTWTQSVKIKLHVGNIPGDVSLYENMRVSELLDYIDRFRPGPDPLRGLLIERLELDTGKKVKALSRGNRQKVAIVMAMMHDPEILILDEPTLGLDPLMQQNFYSFLAEAKDRGRTVFLSSHILSEVERVCDRVGIVRQGLLVDVRSIEELRQNKIRHMDVTFADAVAATEFEKLPQVIDVRQLDNRLRITVRGEIDALVKQVARYRIEDMTFTQPSLEDFFLSFYGPAGDANEPESA
ncbi:MAG: ABC transporter ATP-binding protein [Thermoleophilia bacterium]|nr:ABC transporter ATP-binding protein [Thermoleophilia bacterium]